MRLRWHKIYKNLRNVCKSLYYFKSINMQKAYTWGKKETVERKASQVLKVHIHTSVLQISRAVSSELVS